MNAVKPVDIAVSRSRGTATIEWSDGRAFTLPLAELRRLCPCATCNDVRQQQQDNLFHVLSGAEPSAELAGMDQVGGYAVRFRWSDGHDTGIYSYPYLRQLCDELAETES